MSKPTQKFVIDDRKTTADKPLEVVWVVEDIRTNSVQSVHRSEEKADDRAKTGPGFWRAKRWPVSD